MDTRQMDGSTSLMSDGEQLRAFLRERDVNCPLCNYNLRGQTAGRCPECGRELQLTVGLTEPYLRAWILLAFMTFGTAGVAIFFLYILVEDGIGSRLFRREFVPLLIILTAPVQAAITIFKRRRFLRLSTKTQWSIAWIAGAVSITAVIVFVRSL